MTHGPIPADRVRSTWCTGEVGGRTDPARLDAAFVAVPREEFLPEQARRRAAEDRPFSIGFGQSNSQPRTVRRMLSLLDVEPGHAVLDVGAGSGWTTALLAHLVGPTGSVLGLELVTELARWGAVNLAPYAGDHASLREADPDVLGAPAAAPFDRILVSASARRLPTGLVEQLAVEGVLLVPVGATMTRVERRGPDRTVTTTHGAFSFVPLRW